MVTKNRRIAIRSALTVAVLALVGIVGCQAATQSGKPSAASLQAASASPDATMTSPPSASPSTDTSAAGIAPGGPANETTAPTDPGSNTTDPIQNQTTSNPRPGATQPTPTSKVGATQPAGQATKPAAPPTTVAESVQTTQAAPIPELPIAPGTTQAPRPKRTPDASHDRSEKRKKHPTASVTGTAFNPATKTNTCSVVVKDPDEVGFTVTITMGERSKTFNHNVGTQPYTYSFIGTASALPCSVSIN